MTAQRIGWLMPMIIGMLMIYALWNMAVVRLDLMRAEEYRLELIQQTQAVAAENERLEWEIARSADSAVMERIARTRLGLVYPGELIFCGTD